MTKVCASASLLLFIVTEAGIVAATGITVPTTGTSHALAAQPPPGQEEFVPINQLPPTEQLPAARLLIGAYAFIWAVLFLYVWSLWRRLGTVERELHQVAGRLGTKGRTA